MIAVIILACVPVAAWLILRFDRWLDRAENAASGFQRPTPYTETSERDESFLAGDFDPQAGLDRLRAEAADPTSPARLRPTIPAQRKEQP